MAVTAAPHIIPYVISCASGRMETPSLYPVLDISLFISGGFTCQHQDLVTPRVEAVKRCDLRFLGNGCLCV